MTGLRAVALIVLFAGLAPAQDDPLPSARKKALREGTHVLRRILHDHGFKSLDGMEDLAKEPRRTLLVALGDLEILGRVPGGLEKFVRDGGAVLLASDRPVRDRTARQALVDVAGVSINAETLVGTDPAECYRGLEFCPMLMPSVNPPVNLFENKQNPMEALRAVATNVPSMLRLRRVGLTRRVAVLPPSCLLDLPGGRAPAAEAFPTFAVAGAAGAGRVLALADHSVFINEMMLPQDTRNVEFTYNCVRWLREGDPTRDLVLVMEEGRAQTRLDLPLKSARLPLEDMLRLLFDKRNALLVETERWLAAREREGPFGPRLAAAAEARGIPWGRVVTGFLVVGTLCGTLYFAFRLGSAERFSHDRSAEPLLQAVDSRLPNAPLAQQRIEAMLAGDAREPLRELARRLLDGFDRVPLPISPTWLARWRLAARLRQAWRLATGWPTPIPPNRVAWWQRELDDLRASRDRGEWGRIDGHRAS